LGGVDLALRTQVTCSDCGFPLEAVNGIFRALSPPTKAHFEQFVHNYRVVRTKEGWGSGVPEYYLALPFKDLTNRYNSIWRIRARTLLYMQQHVLPKVRAGSSSGCRILDIGAGNGWLSYRLAKSGHHPTAIDLSDDDIDGLGAARHYSIHLEQAFPRFQADMDHLPFDSSQFDVAIYNASFHYSSDYERTLGEAMRCLRRPALVVIADTPLYWRDESGKCMLQEREAMFRRNFGVCSGDAQSLGYLTVNTLHKLAEQLDIQWHVCKPWYGLNWALRPLKARLLRRREPSKFYLLWFATKN
jgi:ubiquinone/menaquinone biosynthesis C-methylase UbiE